MFAKPGGYLQDTPCTVRVRVRVTVRVRVRVTMGFFNFCTGARTLRACTPVPLNEKEKKKPGEYLQDTSRLGLGHRVTES